MLTLILAASLSAAPAALTPSAAQAQTLAAAKEWDTLYLTFAAASPAQSSRADRAKISKALYAGCEALSAEDPALAYSLGDVAVRYVVTVDDVVCAALAAKHTEQPAAAEELLLRGLGAFRADGRLLLELGRLQREEGDLTSALATWSKISKGSAQAAEVKRLRAEAEGEKTVIFEGDVAEPNAAASSTYESSVDAQGHRVRANGRFRFRYFNGQRDFGQRAEYEGRVQAAVEQAAQASRRFLGQTFSGSLEVVLYSRQEFAQEHGPYASAAVAGFYSGQAIRLNDSAQIDARTQATLVHEYVHAVVDEVAGFHSERVPRWVNEGLAEWVEWRFMGGDAAPVADRTSLRGLALTHALPTLASMREDPLLSKRNPRVAYAYAAMAVRSLAAMSSTRDVLAFIRQVGAGEPEARAFEAHFGRPLARFEAGLQSELSAR